MHSYVSLYPNKFEEMFQDPHASKTKFHWKKVIKAQNVTENE